MWRRASTKFPTSHLRHRRGSSRIRRGKLHGVESLEDRRLLAYAPKLLSSGPDVNITLRNGREAETTIAVNPANPLNMIMGVNAAGAFDTVWNTFDGGQTWTARSIPDPAGFGAGGDPTVVFNRAGLAVYAHLASGGLTSAVSSDGGTTWTAGPITPVGSGDDKEFLAVGPDVSDLSQDRFYLGWQRNGTMLFSSSTNGLTWTAPVTINDVAANEGINAQIGVGRSGELYYAWHSPKSNRTRVALDKSVDGGVTWNALGGDQVLVDTDITLFSDFDPGNTCGGSFYCVPAAPSRGIGASLSIDVDRSGGPNTGNVYIAYMDQAISDGATASAAEHDDTDVFVIRSQDGGASFSPRLRVNDDAGNNSQFYPWLDVDQWSGNVGIAWFDARQDLGTGGPGDTNNVANDDARFYAAVSLDGGLSFSTNVPVSDGTSNGAAAGGFNYGDYVGSAFVNNVFHMVWPDNSNSTGDNANGALSLPEIYYDRAVLMGPDEFEANNSIGTSTILGSLNKITLRDLTIDKEDDQDFFKYTAQDTGKLILNLFYDSLQGDLSLQVVDASGNLIATGTESNVATGLDTENIVIPVVSQEEYFLRVFSPSKQLNIYDLEIENFAAPVPDFVDLPAKDRNEVLNDTGTSVSDDVTRRTEPEIIIQADLDDFASMGINILTAEQAIAMNVPGAAVEVFVNGNSVGFANPIPGTGNTLFRYDFLPGLLPVDLFPADSGGRLHYVKAAVRIIDGQRDANGAPAPAKGRTQLSQPLQLVVDTVPPPVSVPDLLETSDSGDSNTNDVTAVNPPAFRGTAEHNAKIRIFANGILVGQGVAGSDLTNDGFDQIGAWEVTIEPIKYGQYEVWAEAEDLAGNISVSRSTPMVVDPYEPNDTIAEATILGSLPKITLNDVVLHGPAESFEGGPLPDIDRFNYTAQDTGKLMVSAFSANDIELRVLDANGNLIAAATPDVITPGLQVDRIVIPVVSQQQYFLEVFYIGPLPDTQFVQHVAIYDLEIENFAAPVPDHVDLPAKDRQELLNDTGMDVFDDVTSRTEPEILIEADLADFFAMGIDILDPADPNFGNLPGAAVEVFVNGNPVGFATEVPDKGHTLFRYTFLPGQLPETNFPADSRGNLHFVKAAVRIFDGQRDAAGAPAPADGRTLLSEPLKLVVDTVAPTGSVPDMLASSDSGWLHDDEVTNIATPAFQGTAEHNAKVRLFARDVTIAGNPGPWELVGQGVAGSDLTEDGFNQVGSWEITIEPLDDHAHESAIHFSNYEIRAEVEDLAGNISTTDSLPIWIDTFEPNTPYLDLIDADDTGRHSQDNITRINQPEFTVTADDTPDGDGNPFPNDILYRIFDRPDPVQLNGAANDGEVLVFQSTPLSSNGFFNVDFATIPVPYTLLDGVHNLKLEVEDRAGNISHDFLLQVTVDTVAPDGTVELHPESDSGIWGFLQTMEDLITSDNTPLLYGATEANAVVRVNIDGVPGGTSVAVPLDGNEAFPNPTVAYDGNYFLQTILNLPDGEHTIDAYFRDVAGNETPEPGDTLIIFVDSQGPKITNVTRGVVSEDGQFSDDGQTSLFAPKPSDGPDPLIHSIVIHFSDLPDRTALFSDYDALFEALAKEEGNYQLVGDANGNIPILQVNVSFQTVADDGNPETAQVELVFHSPGNDGVLFTADDLGAPLPDDRFTLSVSDTIADAAGNPLDGESGARAPFDGNDVPNDSPVVAPPDSIVDDPAVIFPTGDGEHGGDFQGRFAVDSRAELGVWAAGNVWVDTNGNFHFDSDNTDYTNRDIIYTQGFTSDDVFAGDFNGNGFDELGAYGRVAGQFRWLLDTTEDGDPDRNLANPLNTNGLPAAGDFAAAPGDELVIFTGLTATASAPTWTFHNNTTGAVARPPIVTPAMVGYPIVGDFDGDGFDDLGTYADDVFQIDTVAVGGLGSGVDFSFRFGFIGVRERPIAADFNADGIDDIGLWVPDRSGVVPQEAAEWYILLSGDTSGAANPDHDTVPNTVSVIDRITVEQIDAAAGNPRDPGRIVEFSPIPFGRDVYALFGDQFAIPVVGNFDPPATGDGGTSSSTAGHTNPADPLDVNDDGDVSPLDALLILNALNADGAGPLEGANDSGVYLDVTGDHMLSPLDALLVLNALNAQAVVTTAPAVPASAALSADRVFAQQSAAVAAAVLVDRVLADPWDDVEGT